MWNRCAYFSNKSNSKQFKRWLISVKNTCCREKTQFQPIVVHSHTTSEGCVCSKPPLPHLPCCPWFFLILVVPLPLQGNYSPTSPVTLWLLVRWTNFCLYLPCVVFGTINHSWNTPLKRFHWVNSLVVQWLGLCTSIAGGAGLIPGQGTKIPQATVQPKNLKIFLKNKKCSHWATS